MNSCEVLFPCCTECPASKLGSYPDNCAERDEMSDHSYPYGHVIHYLKLQIARRQQRVNDVSSEQVLRSQFAKEGYQNFDRLLQDNEPNDPWLRERLITGVLSRYPANYNALSSSLVLGEFEYNDGEKVRECLIAYFKIPLPGSRSNAFTMLPLVWEDIRSQKTREIGRIIESSFEIQPHIIGDPQEWDSIWQSFWQKHEIDLNSWYSVMARFENDIRSTFTQGPNGYDQLLLDGMGKIINDLIHTIIK